MNATGFRACVKELYETRYDPVSVNYAVLAGKLIRNEIVRHTYVPSADKYHVFMYVTCTQMSQVIILQLQSGFRDSLQERNMCY